MPGWWFEGKDSFVRAHYGQVRLSIGKPSRVLYAVCKSSTARISKHTPISPTKEEPRNTSVQLNPRNPGS